MKNGSNKSHKRLYYTNAYRTQFMAHVVERLTWEGNPAVVLDRTAFYPASGGQPADRGKLDGLTVIDVVLLDRREEDGAIIHVLSEAPSDLELSPGAEIQGEVDWERRFDHMQQHTGQHILSAAFEQLLDADTVGFHLSEWDPEASAAASSTIDVDLAQLEPEAVAPVETLANQIIWEDHPLKIYFVDSEELDSLSVKRPPIMEELVRIVEICCEQETGPEFDINPCGGTHVNRTGEIGAIKIVGLENRGDNTRVEFMCGKRALLDYREKNEILHRLAKKLTVGYWELDQAVERLQDEIKQTRRTQRKLRERLLDLEAEKLSEFATAHGPYRVIERIWEQPGRPPDELRALAQKATEHKNRVAFLFSIGERTHLCFTRSDDLDLDVSTLLRETCAALGGKGGGRPQAAQGSAPTTASEQVHAALADLLERIS